MPGNSVLRVQFPVHAVCVAVDWINQTRKSHPKFEVSSMFEPGRDKKGFDMDTGHTVSTERWWSYAQNGDHTLCGSMDPAQLDKLQFAFQCTARTLLGRAMKHTKSDLFIPAYMTSQRVAQDYQAFKKLASATLKSL